jgi:hypothetical protein
LRYREKNKIDINANTGRIARSTGLKAMASSRIPNGGMIGQFGCPAITSKSDTISHFLFGIMSRRSVNQTRRSQLILSVPL